MSSQGHTWSDPKPDYEVYGWLASSMNKPTPEPGVTAHYSQSPYAHSYNYETPQQTYLPYSTKPFNHGEALTSHWPVTPLLSSEYPPLPGDTNYDYHYDPVARFEEYVQRGGSLAHWYPGSPTMNSPRVSPKFHDQHPNSISSYISSGPTATARLRQPTSNKRLATLAMKGNYNTWQGYPNMEVIPPPGLSCYEICQQYPNSLNHRGLDAFIQRNWSAWEIMNCLPKEIHNFLRVAGTAGGAGRNPTWLTNRMIKRKAAIVQAGQWDAPLRRDALAGNFFREDGRPAGVQRFKSVRMIS